MVEWYGRGLESAADRKEPLPDSFAEVTDLVTPYAGRNTTAHGPHPLVPLTDARDGPRIQGDGTVDFTALLPTNSIRTGKRRPNLLPPPRPVAETHLDIDGYSAGVMHQRLGRPSLEYRALATTHSASPSGRSDAERTARSRLLH